MTNLKPFLVAWAVLVGVVICLALYRRFVSMHEDNYIHLDQKEAEQVPNQVAIWQRLDAVDRLGKLFTAVAAAGGIALFALYLYNGWMQYR